MNYSSDCKTSKSTPERKKEYIQRWLEGNLFSYHCIDSEEETPSDLCKFNEDCNVTSTHLNSPKGNSKLSSSSCMLPVSPVLGGKRLASSPVIGGHRRTSKRIKLVEKLSTKNETEEVKFSGLSMTKKQEKCSTDNLKVLPECDNKLNNYFTSKTSEILVRSNGKDDKTFPKIFEHPTSQLIESLSSGNKSPENSEIVVQEILSVTDKTESDLIEDISTQFIIETFCNRPVLSSQNISNPSSNSLDETNYFNKEKINVTKDNVNQQVLETFTSTDPIDTVSTLESKVNFNKTLYILHYDKEKQKKRKNPKRGSLLEILVKAMAKERSNVNLLRHQLQKGSNIISDKSYVLFQIVNYLPVNNGNQIFKCLLIEDSIGLLNDFLKNKATCVITVVTVPEISSLLNVCEKPVLKVYQPFIILDPDQLFLQITRFMAVSPNDLKNLSFIDTSRQNKDLKIIHKFYCPCLDKKVLCLTCDLKYTGNSNEGVKLLYDYY